jgi:hypothetical protein
MICVVCGNRKRPQTCLAGRQVALIATDLLALVHRKKAALNCLESLVFKKM